MPGPNQPTPPTSGNPPQRMGGPIVVGMVPGQPAAVLQQAARLATSLGVELIVAHADVTRYAVSSRAGGPGTSAPIDPDGVDEADDAGGPLGGMRAAVALELGSGTVRWSFVQLPGEPAAALGRLAQELHACMIVVGTREPGLGARVEELLTGSVAVHLSHRQNCPVLVVPLGAHTRWTALDE